MKKLLAILGVVLAYWYVTTQDAARSPAAASPQGQTPQGCIRELHWHLETIDPQFTLSKEQARQVIQDAAAHWMASAAGLHIEESADGFPIRFVYDERQQTQLLAARFERNARHMTDWMQRRGESLQQDIAQYNEVQAELRQQEEALVQAAAQLAANDPKRRELAKQAKELSERVAELNQQYEQLRSRQQDLLEVGEDYQELINDAPKAGMMEVGQYQHSAAGNSMTIFAYRDQPSLYLTLLHEFGHALNVPHLGNPDAVMAPEISHMQLTQSQPALTPDDIAAWQQLCQ